MINEPFDHKHEQYNPAMKFVMVLRNPVTRAYSHWNMFRQQGIELLPFYEALLAEPERRDFWEICEDRYQTRSTILTSQLPVSRWHEQIGDPTIADSGFAHHDERIGCQLPEFILCFSDLGRVCLRHYIHDLQGLRLRSS